MWRIVSRKHPGVVHAALERTPRDKIKQVGPGARVTYCGLIAGARTFEPGTVVHGCSACVKRGAPLPRGGAS
jgi:hypothetical protein